MLNGRTFSQDVSERRLASDDYLSILLGDLPQIPNELQGIAQTLL
jgi:hypothetical protein